MTWSPDDAPVGAVEYARLERRFAELLGTERDLVVVQGEAILPLEAVARGIGRPGSRALNLVTSPYGALFGGWLRQSGAVVDDLVFEPGQAASVDRVGASLAGGYDVVSLVHGEAASGVVNPLREIAALARATNALLVVDAVASVGAETLRIDEWGLDLVVLSAQKALAGPTGASAIVVSGPAWEWLEHNPAAPRGSILSLLDWKHRWLDPGKAALPVIPHHVETRLLAEAVDRASGEGLDAVVARHRMARDLCRRGLAALGLEAFVASDHVASAIATTVRPPVGVEVDSFLAAARAGGGPALELLLSAAPAAPDAAIRVNHTGRRATVEAVGEALSAFALGLRTLGVRAEPEDRVGQVVER